MKKNRYTQLFIIWLLSNIILNVAYAQNYPENPWGEEWEHIYDGLDQSTAFSITDEKNVLIINCNIHDVNGVKNALEINNSRQVMIINNTVKGHRFEGHGNAIQLRYGCEDVIIENNNIFDCDGTGISTAGNSRTFIHDNPVPGCIIRGNNIHDVGKWPDPVGNSPKHGMYIKAQDVLVENNIVYNCYDGQALSIRSTGVIRGNTIWNTKSQPFAYWPQKEGGLSGQLIIENNVIYQDDSYDGPNIDTGLRTSLLSIGSPTEQSNYLPPFNTFIVRFNTIAAFKGGLRANKAMMWLHSESYSDVQCYGNNLIDLRDNPTYIWQFEDCTYFSNNYTSSTDGGFVNLSNRNFHLTESHPAVNYAIGVEEFPSTDKFGLTRVANSLDAGAYELFDQGEKYDVKLVVDPYAQSDFFQFRVENNSSSASINTIDLSLDGGATFDLFENGSSYVVSPDPRINADDISFAALKLTFSGSGLAPGGTDQNSDSGWKSDWDGNLTGISATASFSDGKILTGSFVNINDSDDENPEEWVLRLTEVVLPKTAKHEASLVLDPYSNDDFFQFRINNNSTAAAVKNIDLTLNGGATFDRFENGNGYTVSPDPKANADDISFAALKLTFAGNGLAPGSTDQNSNSGWKSDWDGNLTGISATVTFSDGKVLSGSFANVGDSNDGSPNLWSLTLTEISTPQSQIKNNWYRLENKSSGGWVRPNGCSLIDDENVALMQVSKSYDGSCTMFKFVEAGNGWYRIQNRQTGGWYRSKGCSDITDESIVIAQVSDARTGDCTQWRLIDAGDGYHFIENKNSGQRFRPQSCSSATDESVAIVQVPSSLTDDCVKWKLVDTGNSAANARQASASIEEELIEGQPAIYPNPVVDGVLNINLSAMNDSFKELTIVDLQGKEMLHQIVGESALKLDVSHLSKGVYIIKAFGGTDTFTRKIIIR